MQNRLVVHCMRDPYDIYIGRGRCPKTGEMGCWGNPFSHKHQTVASFRVETRDEAVDAYKPWLWHQIKSGKITLEDVAALSGKRLGCWCAPKRCHGEVLVLASAWAAEQLADSR